MIGELEVEVVDDRVTRLRATPPVAAKVLPGPVLMLVGSAAGLLEGDELGIEIRMAAGARLTVRTTAATLAHPCPGGGSTATTVRVELGAGAALAWLPEPLVACAGCRHDSQARLSLGPEAGCVWLESVALGRHGEEAGEAGLRLDVELDGRPLLRDALRWPVGAPAGDPATYGTARHVTALHLLGRDAEVGDIDRGALPFAGPGATVRALATNAHELEAQLDRFQSSFLSILGFDARSGTPRHAEALSHV